MQTIPCERCRNVIAEWRGGALVFRHSSGKREHRITVRPGPGTIIEERCRHCGHEQTILGRAETAAQELAAVVS